jgi:hypothetical protein
LIFGPHLVGGPVTYNGRPQPDLRQSRVEWGIVSPTVLRAKGFRLFFFSREETRMHVHVQSPQGEANSGLSRALSLRKAMAYRRTRST